ncbi:MAG: hypothetical protein WA936_01480 [Erythrobacter sp.]
MARQGARLALGGAAFCAFAAPALACEPTFTQAAQTVTLTATEVSDGARVETSEQIRILNTGSGECNAFLRVSRFSASSSDPARNFTLTSGGQEIDVLPSDVSAASSNSDLFVPAIPSGGVDSRSVPLRFSFPVGWGIASGTTTDTLLVQLIDESGNVFDDMFLTVNLTVLPSVEMRIVGATGNDRIARIDLGALNPRGITRSDPFGLRVWSTSPYTVTFASSNAGALVHDLNGDRIAYELRTTGSEVDLSGASPGALGRRTGALGDFHSLEIAVPPFVAQAGEYTDRVVVTVSAG